MATKRTKNSQQMAIETILKSIEKKYLTREKMYDRILLNKNRSETGVIDIVGRIDMIDAVRENVRTALQFSDYRRAFWYLSLLTRLCERYF